MSNEIDALKDAEKEKLSFEDSASTCMPGGHDMEHWTGGLILIGVGLVFLLTNLTGAALHNWWALFILVPGLVKVMKAVKFYQRDGRFSNRARDTFVWGFILILVAGTFLFNWSWGMIWPAFLIIFGLGALLSGLLD